MKYVPRLHSGHSIRWGGLPRVSLNSLRRIEWVWKESNLRPLSYQDSVLPLNYTPVYFHPPAYQNMPSLSIIFTHGQRHATLSAGKTLTGPVWCNYMTKSEPILNGTDP